MTALENDDIDFAAPVVQLPTPERDAWAPIRLTDLPDQPPIKPTLGGVGLIYPGKRHVFSGPPESAKTLAAYVILIQVVRAAGLAILIDFEMGGYDARQRFRELGATDPEIDRILYLEPDEQATDTRIQTLVDLKPQLVVIDSALGAYTLHNLDDSNRGDVEKLSNLIIRPFFRAGIASIVIDHVVKDAEQRGRWQIGSERKLGGVDVALGFETIMAVSRGTSGRYKVVTNKDRGAYLKRGHVADLNVASDPETHQVTINFTDPQPIEKTDAGFRFDVKMEQISKHLEQHREPTTGNDLFKALAGNRKAHFAALADLLEGGYIRRIGGPNSAIEFVTPFTRDQVVPPGTTVVPIPGGGALVPGTPPYGEVPVPVPSTEPPSLFGWFQDDGTFTPSELSYLESLAPDEQETTP
jgi:hypothetical protein